jgi:hypothetical protein
VKAKRTAPVPLAYTAGTLESGTEANAPFYTAPSGRLGAWQAQQLGKFERPKPISNTARGPLV